MKRFFIELICKYFYRGDEPLVKENKKKKASITSKKIGRSEL